MPGVRARVTAAAVIAMACAFAASAWAVEATLQHDRHDVLIHTAQVVEDEVEELNPNSTFLTGRSLRVPENSSLQSGLVQILRGEKVVDASKLLADSGSGPLWTPGDPLIQSDDPGLLCSPNAPLRSCPFAAAHDIQQIVLPLPHAPSSVRVVVVVSLDQYDGSITAIHRLLEVGFPILLVVVGLICWWIVGRALRRIEALRREVAEVAVRPGERRVAEPRTNDEAGRLARTLNSMLDRLEQLSMRERRFVADASHELRSPIANIRIALEVALHRPPEADWQKVAAEVLAEDARMGRLVEDLLLLARSDEGHLLPAGEASDLLHGAHSAIALRGASSETAVAVSGTPAHVAIPEPYVEHIVGNLVDNGARYAASRVDVKVWAEGRYAFLQVSDDGPGVQESDRGRIFERFVRLDEARDRQHGGFGLGLSIVADLCHAYGGTIEVGDAHPGAVFTVRFPVAPPGSRPRRPAELAPPLAPARR
jgi:signal transduction histidine kinase